MTCRWSQCTLVDPGQVAQARPCRARAPVPGVPRRRPPPRKRSRPDPAQSRVFLRNCPLGPALLFWAVSSQPVYRCGKKTGTRRTRTRTNTFPYDTEANAAAGVPLREKNRDQKDGHTTQKSLSLGRFGDSMRGPPCCRNRAPCHGGADAKENR
jgi:hypothetical protein